MEKLRPDVPALMGKMLERSEKVKAVKYGVDQIAKPYYELCEALSDTYTPAEFENPFEMETWRAEAGL
ncbi:hypothetical protein DSECCO2_659840 [anaerobic digester metagenome]